MKIAIAGFYGSGNTGDEAILSAIISSIRKKFYNVDFTVFSSNPAETKKLHQVESISMSPFGLKWLIEFKRIWKTIKNSDIVIIGGGGLLQDAHNYFSILRYNKIFKKSLMFYSIGVGPIKNRIEKVLVQFGCNLADVITVRDKLSKEILVSLGVDKNRIFVSTDPVFMLPSAGFEKAMQILKKEGVPTRRPLI